MTSIHPHFRAKHLRPALAVGLLAALPYLGTLTYGFAHGDDRVILTHNPAVRQFSVDAVKRALTESVQGAYMPTRLLMHMVEYQLWGMRPAGYHAVNVVLSSLACALLYLLAAQIVSPTTAFMAVVLYAWHPTHVEAVAWVSGRKEVLSSFLMFAALLLATAGARRGWPGWPRALGVLLLCVAAVFAKSTAVVLPALLLALMLATGALSRVCVRGVALFVVLFIVAGAAALVHAKVGAAHGIIKPLHGGTWLSNASYGLYALAEHARLCVLPVCLALRRLPLPASPAYAAVAWGILLGLGAACAAAVRKRRVGLLGFSVLWFCLALAPTSTFLFPTSTTVADRYVFVAGFAPCLLLAAWLHRAARPALFGAAALALAALTLARCPSWQDEAHLWRQAIRDAPNVSSLYESLSAHYFEQGRYREAAGQIERIFRPLRLHPRAMHNLAAAKHRLGQYDEALALYEKAVEVQGPTSPESAGSCNGIGLILRDKGELDESVRMFRIALRLRPGDTIAESNLADTLAQQGKTSEAIRVLQDLLSHWPTNRSARFRLGKLLLKAGQPRAALAQFERAGSTAASEAYAGLCCLALDDLRAARRHLGRAMRLGEYTWEPHYLAGRIAETMGEREYAMDGYRHALLYGAKRPDIKERLKRLEAGGQ